MRDDLIEYEGKEYTVLELAEIMAPKLPKMHQETIRNTKQTIKDTNALIKDIEEWIAQAEENKRAIDIVRYEELLKKQIAFNKRNEAFLKLLLSKEIQSHIKGVSKAAQDDIGSLK